MEGPISFWGYKEQESNLILPEHDDDDDDDDDESITYAKNVRDKIKMRNPWLKYDCKNVNVVSSEIRSYEDLHTLNDVSDQLSAAILNGKPSKDLRKQQQTSPKSQ